MRSTISKGFVVSLGLILASCGGGYGGGSGSSMAPSPMPSPTPTPTPTPAPTPTAYSLTPLVSDGAVTARKTDMNLKNPWGIVLAPGAPAWIVNNGTQTSTLYDGTGNALPIIVTLPGGIRGDADPTGIVFNPSVAANPSTTDFALTKGTTTGPARFIFDGEGGTILGWAPSVDAANGIIAYDDGNGGAVYKGLAVASDGTAPLLFATDFHNGKVDVFDAHFAKVTTTGGFADSTLPAGYAPFGIQAITTNGTTLIYVTYAKKVTGSEDNADGSGLGLVNVFDVHGTLQKHLIAAGAQLNAPWGVAMAPANFGTYSNRLLVGNFGDGVINAFDADTGAFVGVLADSNGSAFANPGLWGIAFGNGVRNQPTTTLYFAAGIAGEADGLYGRIDLGATAPDTVAPTVTLTAPTATTVSGMVALTATASDDKGVTSVEFFANSTSLGTATAAPYTVNWNTSATANGTTVTLTAVAQDAAGNKTTSTGVVVTVNN